MQNKLFILTAALILLFPAITRAEDGVSDTEILFGQTAAFEGPASALGQGMNLGIMAAFKQVNDSGGVKGRRLVVKKMDDGYEPDQAIENSKVLIHQDRVFALIGAVGTPTSKAIQPIASENKIPFIGPFTGAEFLRNPYERYVVNLRGSYYQEAETWIKHLTEDLNAQRIAILYQDDSFGRAGLEGVQIALEKRGLELVGKGTYIRNTTVVKGAVAEIKNSDPDAIVTVGAYKPIAEFIRVARRSGLDVPILNISFTGSKPLAEGLGEEGAGIIITQVVPFPFDISIPLVAEYQRALQIYDPSAEPGFVSLEGYMVGKLTAQALSRIEGDITREKFLDIFAQVGNFDLGGVALAFGPDDNQGMDDVFLTRIRPEGGFESIENLR